MTGQPAPSAQASARRQAAAGRPRRAAMAAIRLRGVAAAAALAATVVAAVALLGGGSAPAPVAPSIMPLRVSSGNGIATGFAVAHGRVITVAHVLDGPVTVGGRRVRVLRADRRRDLALLAVPGLTARAPDIASAAEGEHLSVLRVRDGRRSMLPVHVRRSIVAHVRASAAARSVARPALELAALERRRRIAAGDSGAAVVTRAGAVAGIVFAVSRRRADIAYAVDASELRGLLR